MGCLQRAGLEIEEPQQHSNLQAWWFDARGRVEASDRRVFYTLVVLTAWMLWKQRNERCSGNLRLRCGTAELISHIREEFEVWMQAATEGSTVVTRE
jgi:hypothetical protein